MCGAEGRNKDGAEEGTRTGHDMHSWLDPDLLLDQSTQDPITTHHLTPAPVACPASCADRAFLGEPRVMVRSFITGGIMAILFIFLFSFVGIFGAMEAVLNPDS